MWTPNVRRPANFKPIKSERNTYGTQNKNKKKIPGPTDVSTKVTTQVCKSHVSPSVWKFLHRVTLSCLCLDGWPAQRIWHQNFPPSSQKIQNEVPCTLYKKKLWSDQSITVFDSGTKFVAANNWFTGTMMSSHLLRSGLRTLLPQKRGIKLFDGKCRHASKRAWIIIFCVFTFFLPLREETRANMENAMSTCFCQA